MKILILVLVWLNILGWAIFSETHKPITKIVEKKVEVIKEVPVEKIVYKEGKEIIEKIVEKPIEKTVYQGCSPEVVIACQRERMRDCNSLMLAVSSDRTFPFYGG